MRVEERTQFQQLVQDLIKDDRIWAMRAFLQHGNVTCLDHSFVVAYYSYTLAKRLHLTCDEKALVRGAFLHDYFLYDWHEKEAWHRFHGFKHPFFARKNAQKDFHISEREAEIIAKHMWPLTIIPPTCKEAWVVNGVDTFSSLIEVLIEHRPFQRLKQRWLISKIEYLEEMRK